MLTFNFNPFPILTTERLILRRITNDDAPQLFELRSNKETMKYVRRPLAVTIDDAIALIKIMDDLIDKNDGINWAITLKDNSALIGNIGYYRTQHEHYRSEIGYMLHHSFEKKGIIHEAMKAAIDYGFNTMKLHSIEGVITPENTASAKVLERCNFIREAFYKENFFFNGEFINTAVYSLLTPNK